MINVLDKRMINLISAGEVVERPSSVVKELVDNALDANADSIKIEIKGGGIDYICVTDNGIGIMEEDIVKAFLPHATSKIKDPEDLKAILSMGFRGEALASISAVSEVDIKTRYKDADFAVSMQIKGGEFFEPVRVAGSIGTKIEVRNLFFNTPARRKFLKKPKSEENEITNIVSRIILSNPTKKIKYIVEGKTIFDSVGKDLLSAINCVYGEETTQNLIKIDETKFGLKMYGYLSKVGFSKPNTTYQTLTVNNRYVIDETVSKAIYKAYEEYLMQRQFPFYVLSLQLDPKEVDVNVHPNKLNIKFSNPNSIFATIYTSVRNNIFKSLNLPNFDNELEKMPFLTKEQNESEFNISENTKDDFFKNVSEISIGNKMNDRSLKFSQSEGVPLNFQNNLQNSQNNAKNFENNIELINNFEKNQTNDENIINQDSSTSDLEFNNLYENYLDKNKFKDATQMEFLEEYNFSTYKKVGIIFNEFLILEKDDNILLIDFHAGHERLLFDKLKEQVKNKSLVIQNLLIPFTMKVSLKEMEFLQQLFDSLINMGFDIDAIADDIVRVSSVPLIMKDINLKEFFENILSDLKTIPNLDKDYNLFLATKACKSAVKSGMILNDLEINTLLKDLDISKPVLLCPHGRPIVTTIKRSAIEKWFKRIV